LRAAGWKLSDSLEEARMPVTRRSLLKGAGAAAASAALASHGYSQMQ
jgi:hypothetical protein